MTASMRTKTALLLTLASLALLKIGALVTCTSGHCRGLAFDTQVLVWLHAERTPALDIFFGAVTWAGSLYVLLPLALLLTALDTHATTTVQRWFVPLALVSHWPVVHVAKLLIARPRPTLFEPLIALPADGSFPSAHTAQITAFACAWLLRPAQRPSPLPATTLLIIVLSVALSRLYLQVHHPSDVVFAIAASALWVLALRYALDALRDIP